MASFLLPQSLVKINPNRSIKIFLPLIQCGEVRLISAALDALEAAYSGLYQWNLLVTRAERHAQQENGMHQHTPEELDSDFPMRERDALCLAGVEVTAPAYIEIVGAAGIIEFLRRYLSDARTHKRNGRAKERWLALEQGRLDAIREQVEMLIRLNYPETQIRETLSKYVLGPLERLDRFEGLSLYEEERPEAEQRLSIAGEG